MDSRDGFILLCMHSFAGNPINRKPLECQGDTVTYKCLHHDRSISLKIDTNRNAWSEVAYHIIDFLFRIKEKGFDLSEPLPCGMYLDSESFKEMCLPNYMHATGNGYTERVIKSLELIEAVISCGASLTTTEKIHCFESFVLERIDSFRALDKKANDIKKQAEASYDKIIDGLEQFYIAV